MKKHFVHFIILLPLVYLTACAASQPVSTQIFIPTVTPQPPQKPTPHILHTVAPNQTPSLTPENVKPTATPDLENLTDNPLVNETIAALIMRDIEILREKILLNTQGCTHQDGLGGPPKCAPGQAEGTPVDFLPVFGGEGTYIPPGETDRVFNYESAELFAVILVTPPGYSDPVFPQGTYAVVLEVQPDGMTRTFRLNDSGQIVRVDYVFGTPLEEARQIQGEILYSQ